MSFSMFSSKPATAVKLPPVVNGGNLYIVKILELGGKLYIKDNVTVKGSNDAETRGFADQYAFEIGLNNKPVSKAIDAYVKEPNMFGLAAAVVPGPGGSPAPAPVSKADITALLTTVRGLVDGAADDAAYTALTDPAYNAIINVVKAGTFPAPTKADALQKIDNALAAVAGVAIDQADTVESKTIALVTAANIAAPGAPPALVTEDDIRDLLTLVELEVQGTADDAGFNALNGTPYDAILNVVKAGTYPAATRDQAIQKLANALASVAGVPIIVGNTAQEKAIELVAAAPVVPVPVVPVPVVPVPVVPAPVVPVPVVPAPEPNQASVEALLMAVRGHLNAGGDPADDRDAIGNPADAAELAVFDSLFVAGVAGGVAATTREEAVNRINNAIGAVRLALPPRATDEAAAIAAIEGVNIADNRPIVGGNQYTYGKQKAYPKNVTFSKKTMSKQTHKKTIRKLQKIINNILL